MSVSPNGGTSHQESQHATLAPRGGVLADMVDVTSLDAFTADYGIPHLLFVKMDVQGAEPQALAGMARLLERGAVDFIMFEYVK